MNKGLYRKLAWQNMKNHHRTYVPYILTCICTTAMFYIMNFLNASQGVKKLPHGRDIQMILAMGTGVIAIFSVIFLFYTNSFLMKKRKKEIGLYNILGMEKKHIARVLLWEIFIVAIISILSGIFLGIVGSKLMFMILLKLIGMPVPLGFEISVDVIKNTAALFCAIYLLSYLNNLRQIHLARPVELLSGSQVGEREPKSNWLLVILGVLCLGSGYYIAITTESVLTALAYFFPAVVLVMIGTYCLFTAISIVALKLLRKNRKFYYKTRHFISVSGLIYRMKQNAVGLANICILSTGVLLMISTTVSLYVGREDVLRERYPKEIQIQVEDENEENMEKISSQLLKEYDLKAKDELKFHFTSEVMLQEKDGFVSRSKKQGASEAANDIAGVVYIPLEEYNHYMGRSVELRENEALLFVNTRKAYGKDEIKIKDQIFRIKEELEKIFIDVKSYLPTTRTYYLVVKDLDIAKRMTDDSDYGNPVSSFLMYDLEGDETKFSDFSQAVMDKMREVYPPDTYFMVEGRTGNRDTFQKIDGGFLFLGVFLGCLFLMGTTLIIYYKQVSEGYEDHQRFQIMRKVGLSKREVKASIRSQILLVFFLPLVMAMVHIVMAFPLISRLMALMYLTNMPLFAVCTAATVLVFVVVYAVIFLLTARTYNKIVNV